MSIAITEGEGSSSTAGASHGGVFEDLFHEIRVVAGVDRHLKTCAVAGIQRRVILNLHLGHHAVAG